MTNTQVISNLWQEMREAINQTYANAGDDQDLICLRDYSENTGWVDDLQKLLGAGAETANEKQHRGTRPQVVGFSSGTASKLILMQNVIRGARLPKLPSAVDYLRFRHTAFEAEVIGFLVRKHLHADWIKAVDSFDYAQLMAA
jgi:hypothetical protein